MIIFLLVRVEPLLMLAMETVATAVSLLDKPVNMMEGQASMEITLV